MRKGGVIRPFFRKDALKMMEAAAVLPVNPLNLRQAEHP